MIKHIAKIDALNQNLIYSQFSLAVFTMMLFTYLFVPKLKNVCGSTEISNQNFRQLGQGVPGL